MNTRSLKFQLLGWYALLLASGFGLLGVATYVALERSLTGAVMDSQLRRARQLVPLLLEQRQPLGDQRLGEEIEARYAPDRNDRFVRISREDGSVLYLSAPPIDQSFDPASLPPPAWPSAAESSRKAPLLGGRQMLLTSHKVQAPEGMKYLIETGAPMDDVQADMRHWLTFLGVGLPVEMALALGGGYVLVKRALGPVDRIAASAERISSSNLSERLPVPQTGDELERLSVALNHMIQRLEEALQYSRRFVADASHELRTPLTILRGEIESFVQDPRLTADRREQLGSVLEEVEHLTHIVEGLFAMSRLDAGEAQSEWVRFDLAQLAAATADQMALLAEDKKIRLSCVANGGVWVEGDRSRLKQVVVNLLDNAIKYTPPEGAVSLAVKAVDGHAVLEVQDTGIGIPAEALPRIFERFFRVDRARSREQGGAGLGLSIVKSICAAHYGRVEATSTPDKGSHFRVELPLAKPQTKQPFQNS